MSSNNINPKQNQEDFWKDVFYQPTLKTTKRITKNNYAIKSNNINKERKQKFAQFIRKHSSVKTSPEKENIVLDRINKMILKEKVREEKIQRRRSQLLTDRENKEMIQCTFQPNKVPRDGSESHKNNHQANITDRTFYDKCITWSKNVNGKKVLMKQKQTLNQVEYSHSPLIHDYPSFLFNPRKSNFYFPNNYYYLNTMASKRKSRESRHCSCSNYTPLKTTETKTNRDVCITVRSTPISIKSSIKYLKEELRNTINQNDTE